MQASSKCRQYQAVWRSSNQRSCLSKASCWSPFSCSNRMQSCCIQGPCDSSHGNSSTNLHKPPLCRLVPNSSSLTICHQCTMGPSLQQYRLQDKQQCIIRRHMQQQLVHTSLGCIQRHLRSSNTQLATQLTRPGSPAMLIHTMGTPLCPCRALGLATNAAKLGIAGPCRWGLGSCPFHAGLSTVISNRGAKLASAPHNCSSNCSSSSCCSGCCV